MDEGNGSEKEQKPIDQMTFEEALAALGEVVNRLERGDVPLDESIAIYERGELLRAACQKRLDSAQARIEKIVAGADGNPTGTAPLDGGS
ncbi:exodeoxyribonuclease VII small subunit [Qipengyuania nanhaisediminis]|uniref:exodeoxyribonuclease VII small subunit n=1 Tax=Qipengyuania nanhaisediminis TaxID=604088 RepID=UPI0038B3CC94